MGTVTIELCLKSLNVLSFARLFVFEVCLGIMYLRPRGGGEGWFVVPRLRTHRFGRDGYSLVFWIWCCCYFGHTVTFQRCNLVGSSLMSGTYLPEVLQGHVQKVDLCEAKKCLCYVQMNCWV